MGKEFWPAAIECASLCPYLSGKRWRSRSAAGGVVGELPSEPVGAKRDTSYVSSVGWTVSTPGVPPTHTLVRAAFRPCQSSNSLKPKPPVPDAEKLMATK